MNLSEIYRSYLLRFPRINEEGIHSKLLFLLVAREINIEPLLFHSSLLGRIKRTCECNGILLFQRIFSVL